MPLKNGTMTPAEVKISAAMAATGDRAYAQQFAKVSQPAVSKALQRPAVQAEIARLEVERLFTEALPAAVTCIINMINNEKAPAGARVQAVKVVLDRTLGSQEAMGSREPFEMSGDELARAIDELTRLAADKALPVQARRVDDTEPDAGVLG